MPRDVVASEPPWAGDGECRPFRVVIYRLREGEGGEDGEDIGCGFGGEGSLGSAE